MFQSMIIIVPEDGWWMEIFSSDRQFDVTWIQSGEAAGGLGGGVLKSANFRTAVPSLECVYCD